MKTHENLTGTFIGISRREMLQALGVAAAGAVLPASELIGQTGRGQANPRRIDVHHHPEMPATAGVRGGGGGGTRWTREIALDMMDKHGIETTIVSQPGSGGDAADETEKGRAAARRVNEFHAKLVSDYPKRYGFFATIPYPDVDGAMKELEYSFDTLKADGVLLTSSVGSRWPGDPHFDPVWAEMNRRKVIMFMHPLVPVCCRNLIPFGEASVERDFDTTRAVTNLLYQGTLSKYPDIRYIINHSGAAVPVLAGRIKDRVPGVSTYGSWAPGKKPPNNEGKNDKIPNGVFYELKKLYYEVAHAAYPAAMAALLAFAPTSQLLFGTDFPAEPMESTLDELPKNKLSPAVLQALYRGNAERLFPKFKSS